MSEAESGVDAERTGRTEGAGTSRPARSSVGMRRERLRRPVIRARFAAVVLLLPDDGSPAPTTLWRRPAGRIAWAGIVATAGIAALAGLFWWSRPPESAAAPEDVFVFEDIPVPKEVPQALPDPSPPPPLPAEEPPNESPPPRLGLQEEQLSETGDLAAAAGNTLMTEADSMIQASVEALPHAPSIADQAPRILRGRAPEYPARALERRMEATVVVIIAIDTLGRVIQVDVERSGGRDFDPGVVRAVERLVFQPPVRNGRLMTARFRQAYEFKLR